MSLEPQSGSSEEEEGLSKQRAKVQNFTGVFLRWCVSALVCFSDDVGCPTRWVTPSCIKKLLQAVDRASNVDAIGASYYIQVAERLL